MHFNNILNRLRLNRIYTILAVILVTILITLLLLLGLAFKDKKAFDVLEDYVEHLQNTDYNEAVKLIIPEEQEHWENVFYKFLRSPSADSQLAQELLQNSSLELISETTVDEETLLLKISVLSYDGPDILRTISEDMQSAKIDVTDPEIVRTGESREDMISYYALDNLEDYKNLASAKEIIIEMHKKNKLFKTEWLISPSDELHKLLYGKLTLD